MCLVVRVKSPKLGMAAIVSTPVAQYGYGMTAAAAHRTVFGTAAVNSCVVYESTVEPLRKRVIYGQWLAVINESSRPIRFARVERRLRENSRRDKAKLLRRIVALGLVMVVCMLKL